METYGEFVSELVDWVTNRSGTILVFSATLPLALLLREGRLVAYGVVGVFAGAVMLIVFDIESTVAAMLVVLASSLLFSTVVFSTRRRLAQIEDRLSSMASAIDRLEMAEERRQTFSTRRAPNSRLLTRLQSTAAAAEKAVSPGAAAMPGKETPAFPDLYSQEPRAAGLRPEFAEPSAQHDPAFFGTPAKAPSDPSNSAGDGSSLFRRRRRSL
ncbi:conserved membrane hypothetical protein [Mesorhizobium sp. ORS 3324]|nr:conserved membrane hypothetical protein [Mesorhizobium sp. ORS 3324]